MYRDERLKRKQLTFSSYAERWVWCSMVDVGVLCLRDAWIRRILYVYVCVCIMFAITSTAKLSRDKTFAVF